jgi:FkbM family methyltransferase
LLAALTSMRVGSLFSFARRNAERIRAACRRASGGVAEIESGPAKGLRFDAGSHTQRFASGQYERPVQDALASLVRPGDVCCDIGANLGFFSILLSRFSGPTGSIYAFEPVPDNASLIEGNARLNRMENIKVSTLALSCADGKGELLLARHVGGAVLKSVGAPPDLAGSITVETASLDALVEHGRVEPPDVVKIDVEGAEMEVLRGMEQVLRKWAPALIVELDDSTVTACERKVFTCRSFLHELGYRTEILPASYPDGRWFVRHVLARRGRGGSR